MPIQHRRLSDRPDTARHWVFEKRISLDTLVGIVGIALVIGGPFIYWGRAIEGRVLSIELKDEARNKSDDKRDVDAREFRALISAQLTDLGKQMTQTQITLGILSGKVVAPDGGRK